MLLAAANHAVAQYSVTSWTTENGLPQSSVIAIDQTPDGFLWVTTLGGLARFDGRTFQTFDTTTNPELPHTRFAGVRTDAEGQLWVTLQTGQLLRFTNGQFELMGPAHGLPDGLVLRIAPVSGQFTVETTEGIAVWRDGRFVVDPAMQPPPPSSGLTFAGFAPGASVRWYRDREGRAHRVENGQITRSIDLPGGAIREDRSGRVWSLVLPAGTLVVADTDGNIRHYGRDDGLLPAGSFSGIEEPDGTIWYPARDGLTRFRDGVFTPFGTADGLPDALVRVVFLDREGSLWVGTNRGLAVSGRPVARVDAAGALSVTGVIPGPYVVAASVPAGNAAAGAAWRLASVMIDDEDVTDRPVEIGPGTGPITITFTDGAGRYVFRGLPPGNYRIAVTTDLVSRDLQEHDVLEQLLPQSLPVTVTFDEPRTLDTRKTGR